MTDERTPSIQDSGLLSTGDHLAVARSGIRPFVHGAAGSVSRLPGR